jgi:hypothetical protein
MMASNAQRYTTGVNYEPNRVGAECFELEAQPLWVPTPFPNNPIWRRMHQVFDPEHFLYPAPPPDLGRMDPQTKSLRGLRILRCPVKSPGMDHLLVPSEIKDLSPLLQHALETEVHTNPRFAAFCSHISFECTQVTSGSHQRVPGWHVDGFQGVRVPTHQVEHSYLWADRNACEFSLQPYLLSHLDRSRHNVFAEIERQAHEQNAVAGLDKHLYLIDPYMVHRSPRLNFTGWRSVFRLTFTETELEDPMNTVNLSMDTSSGYKPRIDARDRFSPHEGDVPWALYGLKKRAD